MLQVQCPNCGGYRTTASDSQSWTNNWIKRPRNPAETRRTAVLLWVLCFPVLAVVFYLVFWTLFLWLYFQFSTSNPTLYEYWRDSETVPPSLIVACAVFSLTPALLLTAGAIRKDNNKPVRDSVSVKTGRPGMDCHCELCNYRWHLDPGEPTPLVRPNPALIAAGEEKLRLMRKQKEVEEAEAKRKSDLEAAHWNYWHNPDNPWHNPDNTSIK